MPRPDRFQPLVDYLAISPGRTVILTFTEIVTMIGGRLPEEAVLRPSWWRRQAHRPVQLWQALGWEARADRDHLRVTFTRMRDEE